jgi:arginyl-tRNA synthetase
MIDFARENGFREFPPSGADLSLINSAEEIDLIKCLADFEEIVKSSALSLEPHRIVVHLIDLAGRFHRFYHNHRVVTDDRAMSEARLYLCWAMRTVLRSGLSLIGISAPEKM